MPQGRYFVVTDRDLTTPPALPGPTHGIAYIPAATATGDWATHEGEIATFFASQESDPPTSGYWLFETLGESDLVYVKDEDQLFLYYSSGLKRIFHQEESQSDWHVNASRNATPVAPNSNYQLRTIAGMDTTTKTLTCPFDCELYRIHYNMSTVIGSFDIEIKTASATKHTETVSASNYQEVNIGSPPAFDAGDQVRVNLNLGSGDGCDKPSVQLFFRRRG